VSTPVIAAPLRVEWAALRRARTAVVCTGMGPRRSLRSAARLGDAAVLVAGVAGGLAAHLRVGDLVVADEIRAPDGTVRPCPAAAGLADDLRRLGLVVHCGPIFSWPRMVDGKGRRRLAATGALAVEMESAWLVPADATRFAVVRAISDTAAAPVLHPAILTNGLRALRTLHRAVPALDTWATTIAMEVS
jgi:4-hydroxy-3-methylbut-2-enyl diphosphate reductase